MHSTSPYIIPSRCSINLSSGLASKKTSTGYVLVITLTSSSLTRGIITSMRWVLNPLLNCTKLWISWEPESIRQYPMHVLCMICSAMQLERKHTLACGDNTMTSRPITMPTQHIYLKLLGVNSERSQKAIPVWIRTGMLNSQSTIRLRSLNKTKLHH